MNKEIKIIDLINKELNDEEMPLLIKYLGLEFSYAKYKNDYILLFADEETYFFRDIISGALTFGIGRLNNKVETLNDFEEDKPIIEKIEIEEDSPTHFYITNEYGTKCSLTKHSKMIADKLNEIIDYIIKKENN